MLTTTKTLEHIGKTEFAKLFERIFPDGVETEGMKLWQYRNAVRARKPVFELRDNAILVCCEVCGKHHTVSDNTIAIALSAGRLVDCCTCYPGKGNALPVYKRYNTGMYEEDGWVAKVEILEDNSDDDWERYLLRVVQTIHPPWFLKPLENGSTFEVLANKEYKYDVGWNLIIDRSMAGTITVCK